MLVIQRQDLNLSCLVFVEIKNHVKIIYAKIFQILRYYSGGVRGGAADF